MRATRTGFVIVLLLALCGVLWAEEAIKLRVKAPIANVRVSPDAASQALKQVKNGVILTASAKNGDWYTVGLTDDAGKPITGYIHRTAVEIATAEDLAAPAPLSSEKEVQAEKKTPPR